MLQQVRRGWRQGPMNTKMDHRRNTGSYESSIYCKSNGWSAFGHGPLGENTKDKIQEVQNSTFEMDNALLAMMMGFWSMNPISQPLHVIKSRAMQSWRKMQFSRCLYIYIYIYIYITVFIYIYFAVIWGWFSTNFGQNFSLKQFIRYYTSRRRSWLVLGTVSTAEFWP